ncbi:MmcQ/YjbR family DNA-binding protein [Nocardia sp. NPDC051321]|uniref:MmcQ/YjbR family DNA-binding protein n=1 Tax=Nocardia sp. NPDC051321 TaxID=3364323 RepID=UPI003798FDA4
MADDDDVRSIALSFPEATEQPHHGFPSFRVRDKVFATLPDPDHLHVMCSEADTREAAAENPDICEEKWWGKRLAGVRVTLAAASADLVAELLTDAWRNKAPRTLVRNFDAES